MSHYLVVMKNISMSVLILVDKSEGPFVKLFEEQMANFVGRNYTACTSGTAAIDIAVSALEQEVMRL